MHILLECDIDGITWKSYDSCTCGPKYLGTFIMVAHFLDTFQGCLPYFEELRVCIDDYAHGSDILLAHMLRFPYV